MKMSHFKPLENIQFIDLISTSRLEIFFFKQDVCFLGQFSARKSGPATEESPGVFASAQ